MIYFIMRFSVINFLEVYANGSKIFIKCMQKNPENCLASSDRFNTLEKNYSSKRKELQHKKKKKYMK